jgi:hypothetical protein
MAEPTAMKAAMGRSDMGPAKAPATEATHTDASAKVAATEVRTAKATAEVAAAEVRTASAKVAASATSVAAASASAASEGSCRDCGAAHKNGGDSHDHRFS